MTFRDLTVKERILLHLFDYNRFAEEYEAPVEVTQSGIAKAVGIRVQHVTQYAKPLMEEGQIEERTRHIQQMPRRRKTYFLTEKGRHHVASQRGALLQEDIPFRRMGGEVQLLPLSQVYLEERRGTRLVELLAEANATGYVSEAVEVSAPGIVDFSQETPTIDAFYGREDELRQVVDALDQASIVVVAGIAGIGKTTLGSKVCEAFRGEKSVLWRRIRSWEGAADLAFHFAGFLRSLGRPRLHNYLNDSAPKELARLEQILVAELPGVNALFVLDDVHTASEDAENFLSILHGVIRQTEGSSVLLLSRRVPGFYSRRDVEIEGSIVEVSLEGLDGASRHSILRDAGIPERETTDLIELSGGNPLFLKLLARTHARKAVERRWKTLETYISEEIEPGLTASERNSLQIASFYEIPVPSSGIMLETGTGKRTLVSLQKQGFLDEVGERGFVVHDVLRDYFQRGLSSERRKSLTSKVVGWLQEEAQARKSSDRPRDAIGLLENAVKVDGNSSRRTVNLERLGRLRLAVLDALGAIPPFEEALENAKDVYVRGRLRERLAFCYSSVNRLDEAEELVRIGLEELPPGASVEAGRLLTLKAAWAWSSRDYDEAWNLLDTVLGWRDEFPKEHHLWARAIRYRGWLHLFDTRRRDLERAETDF
ncbi:MAG: AAA family ATPase, partial [candidate division NC10 bacterium]